LKLFLSSFGHKTDLDSCDDDGLTPLHVAAKNDNIEMVEALLLNGAAPGVKNYIGKSPLDLAKEAACKKVLKRLEEVCK